MSTLPRDGAYNRCRSGRVRRKGEDRKLDVGSNSNTTMRYNIRGIPTLLLFKDGRVVAQKVGAVGKREVQKLLDSYL